MSVASADALIGSASERRDPGQGLHVLADRTRVAIVATHPIQHFAPFYRALALQADIDLQVIFGSRIGVDPYFDREMNAEVRWEMDLLSGYSHSFLPEAPAIKSTAPFAMNNPSVGRHLSALRPDVVIVYGYANLTALRTILWAVLARVPILMISDSEAVHARSLSKRAIKQILLRPLAALVAGFLTVGDNNERYWRGLGVSNGRMFRTPFTIDEATYRRVREQRASIRCEWRARHGIGDQEAVFLGVGKLSPRKGQMDLVAALELANQMSKRPIRLVLAGDGENRHELEALAQRLGQPVTFLGFVNVDALPAAYAAADAVIHAASFDAHPLVFSEAACIGLPILTSDRVGAIGPSDIARPGKNALVFRFGDVRAIGQLMAEVADAPARLTALGQASLEVFETQAVATALAGFRAALGAAMAGRASPRASAP